MKYLVRFCLMGVLLITSFSAIAQEERLQVVASYSILGDVVHNIAEDVADIVITMPAGADPHSFEPVPSDIVAIADADVIFVNGALFEEGLLEAIENADSEMNIVTASSCVSILSFEDAHDDHDHEEEADDHDHEEDADDHDHEDDADDHDHEDEELSADMMPIHDLCEDHLSELGMDDNMTASTLGMLYSADCGEAHHDEDHEEEDHAEEEHDHGTCDPHVWMDVDNVMLWVLMIRDTLIELDPTNTETYTANATSYLQALTDFRDNEWIPLVESVPQENRILVSNHASLGYLADRFGYEIVTTVIPNGSTLAEPSVADVADVIDLVRESEVQAIFSETTVSDAIAQTIADETGADLFVLYSGSLSEAGEPASTYLDYMRYNATTIANALGGL